jgi:hypothetical protein
MLSLFLITGFVLGKTEAFLDCLKLLFLCLLSNTESYRCSVGMFCVLAWFRAWGLVKHKTVQQTA